MNCPDCEKEMKFEKGYGPLGVHLCFNCEKAFVIVPSFVQEVNWPNEFLKEKKEGKNGD